MDSDKNTSNNNNQMTTSYENVTHRTDTGSLILGPDRIIFQASDDHKEDQNSSDYWRWGAILKHQVTSTRSQKKMLRLISCEDPDKSVVFRLDSLEQQELVRRDITRRLREYRRKCLLEAKRRVSMESISRGSFSSRKDDDASFHTVQLADSNNNMADSMNRRRWPSHLDQRRRVSFGAELDETNHSRGSSSSYQRMQMPMLLDMTGPVSSSTRLMTQDAQQPSKVQVQTKSLAKSEDARFRNTNISSNTTITTGGSSLVRMLRYFAILVFGTIAITASTIMGRLGYYNGMVEKPMVDWSEIFSSAKKTPTKNNKRQNLCLWTTENWEEEEQCNNHLLPVQLFK